MSDFRKLYERKVGKMKVEAVDGTYGKSIIFETNKKKPDGSWDKTRLYLDEKFMIEFIDSIQQAAMALGVIPLPQQAAMPVAPEPVTVTEDDGVPY